MTTFTIDAPIKLQKYEFSSIMDAVYHLTVGSSSGLEVNDFEIEYFDKNQQQELLANMSHQNLTSALKKLGI